MGAPRCERCGKLCLSSRGIYRLNAQRGNWLVCATCWVAKGRRPLTSSLIPAENSSLKPHTPPRPPPPANRTQKLGRHVA